MGFRDACVLCLRQTFEPRAQTHHRCLQDEQRRRDDVYNHAQGSRRVPNYRPVSSQSSGLLAGLFLLFQISGAWKPGIRLDLRVVALYIYLWLATGALLKYYISSPVADLRC